MSARRAPARPLPARSLRLRELPNDLFHELANLVASVRLAAHVGRQPAAAPGGDDLADQLEATAARASVLLASLRACLGLRALQRGRVAPRDLLAALGRSLGERPRPGVRLLVVRPPRLPDVRTDPELVHAVVSGLCQQALEGCGPGGRVRVSARYAGREVALVLEDPGASLPVADADALRRGRGLLLRAAHAVLRRAEGRLLVALLPRGNRIEVRLPALPRPQAPEARAARRRRA